MFAKGNPHANGVKLVNYMMTGKEGERVEFGEARGFDFFHADLSEAARLMDRMAGLISKAENPWFHTQTRLPADERLTRAQWEQVVDRQEKVLGFTGQPRIWTMHVNEATGERHLHVAWHRIDVQRECAINPGLYKNKLKLEVSRYLEKQLGLRRIGNERQESDRARYAGRNEVDESRRLGTDVRAIRAAILDCFEKSDSGRAFKAALEERGMVLANADRRDGFMVIDATGGHHALNKKLTGLTLAETRARLSDLDRAQLPGVEKAKELQAARARERQAREAEQGRGAEKAQPEIKPLGKTAGEIRLAWQLTSTAAQFAQAIEDRGLILVHVSAEEAAASQRAQAFAKAIGGQNRAVKEGFAVVDARGNVTRIDQRTTGEQWEVIEKRLAGIDRERVAQRRGREGGDARGQPDRMARAEAGGTRCRAAADDTGNSDQRHPPGSAG